VIAAFDVFYLSFSNSDMKVSGLRDTHARDKRAALVDRANHSTEPPTTHFRGDVDERARGSLEYDTLMFMAVEERARGQFGRGGRVCSNVASCYVRHMCIHSVSLTRKITGGWPPVRCACLKLQSNISIHLTCSVVKEQDGHI
jgi:hypothetical protein